MCVYVSHYEQLIFWRDPSSDFLLNERRLSIKNTKLIISVVQLVITRRDTTCELESKKDSHPVLSTHSMVPHYCELVSYMRREQAL